MNTLMLSIEAAGCRTTCMHCWARGGAYAAMPFDDVQRVVTQFASACDDAGWNLMAYPMHEAAAHPEAARMIALCAPYQGDAPWEPFTTTGVPLVLREDWSEVFAALKAAGSTTVWTHFHGVGDTHDAVVHRAGAFDEACVALRRAKDFGFELGCNVFVTTPMLAQTTELIERLNALGVGQQSWEIASFFPHNRMRIQDAVRPTLEDLRPLRDAISAATVDWSREPWQMLEARTEAAYVKAALTDPAVHTWRYPTAPDRFDLVCRPSLDVHLGAAGVYGQRLGNLRQDSAAGMLQKAVAVGGGHDSMRDYFIDHEDVPIAELARRHGHANGTKIHPHAPSMRVRWLDEALADRRKY